MSRNKHKAARERRDATPTPNPSPQGGGGQVKAAPTGYIMCASEDTGKPERMAYWLPDGVTAEDIGLKHGRAM